MLMLGRIYTSSDQDYKFGFNGQGQDDEVSGKGNKLNFKYRCYDPRIARFFAVEPLSSKYPWYTPYQFAGKTPIWARELEGLEPIVGELNYGKNILFGWQDHVNSIHSEQRDLSNTNWIGMFPGTIKDASDYINKVKKEVRKSNDIKLQVKNVVVAVHGYSFGNGIKGINGTPIQTSSFTNSSLPDPNQGIAITSEAINMYLNNLGDDTFNKNEGAVIGQLQDLMNEVEDNGNFIFLACDIGTDVELMKQFYKLLGERINVIASHQLLIWEV